MSSLSSAAQPAVPRREAAVGVVTAYAVLGAALCYTRFAGLGQSFWFDEIIAAADIVDAGVGYILTGPGLQHGLYLLLAWASAPALGESETALRLWSVVPFVAGVAIVTSWLHRRTGPLSAIVFLFLCTASPLLLDITRQARGYGLAFLAMSVVVVAALEAIRTRHTGYVVAVCCAGIVGAWTLPQFAFAFFATGAALLVEPSLRRRVLGGLALSALAVAVWYAPRLGDLRQGSEIEYGVPFETAWLVTAPIDQILLPALLWIDGTVLVPGIVWVPAVAALCLLIGSSPLLDDGRTALVLTSGPVVTVVALWAAGAYSVPRYLSYLLVPAFALLATGIGSVLSRLPSHPALLRTTLALVLLGSLLVWAAPTAVEVTRLPREAFRDAAAAIERHAPDADEVLVYATHHEGMSHYLESPVRLLRPGDVVAQVCRGGEPTVFVVQPFVLPEVNVPCLARSGVRFFRFEQYTRGDEITVWLVPPLTPGAAE